MNDLVKCQLGKACRIGKAILSHWSFCQCWRCVYFAEVHHYSFQENQIPSSLDYNLFLYIHNAYIDTNTDYITLLLACMSKHLLYLCEIAVHCTLLRLVKSLSVSHATEVLYNVYILYIIGTT